MKNTNTMSWCLYIHLYKDHPIIFSSLGSELLQTRVISGPAFVLEMPLSSPLLLTFHNPFFKALDTQQFGQMEKACCATKVLNHPEYMLFSQ